MHLRCIVRAFSVMAAVACLGLLACSDEDEEEEHAEEHGPITASCVELSETCHEADTGSGPEYDCHEIAHEDDEDACAAALPDCMTTCAT